MQAWIMRNRLTVGAGVGLFIVILLVVAQFSGGSQAPTQQATNAGNPWFWLAALVLLAGAGASFANRGGAPARWALGILIVILGLKFISGIVFGEKAVEVEQNVRNGMANVVLGKAPSQKSDAPTATTGTQAVKQEAKWERLPDGSIPVGVWSSEMRIDPECSAKLDAGNGVVYKTQYRLYGSEWKDHTPKTKPDGDEVRFFMIKEGVHAIPIRIKCS